MVARSMYRSYYTNMPNLQLNENRIKITGSLAIDGELELDQLYSVGAVIDITHDGRVKNDDGTFDKVFTGRLTKALVTDNLGKTFRTKDKTRQSVKLRMAILGLHDAFSSTLEENAWYEMIMGGIRHNLQEIIEKIIKEN